MYVKYTKHDLQIKSKTSPEAIAWLSYSVVLGILDTPGNFCKRKKKRLGKMSLTEGVSQSC